MSTLDEEIAPYRAAMDDCSKSLAGANIAKYSEALLGWLGVLQRHIEAMERPPALVIDLAAARAQRQPAQTEITRN